MAYLFTSESVSEGHPDKVADQISDAILDEFLAQDINSRVACETLVTTGLVVVSGEITSKGVVDIQKTTRDVIKRIGYTKSDYQFDSISCAVINSIHEQSPDISQGVSEGKGLHKEQGAGDQGMMFGYASNETDNLMPLPLDIAHKLVHELSEIRKEGKVMKYLRPDSKSQVTIEYTPEGKPKQIHTIVVSTQHDDFKEEQSMLDTIRKDILKFLIPRVEKKYNPTLRYLFKGDIKYHVNPTGKFVIGGPHGDTGLTGRKIIVDTYGGKGAHGGGAFSGKDPSKVDRSAAYAARHIAKNLVGAGVCDQVLVQVAYAIGVAEPVSLYINTFGTASVKNKKGEKMSDFEISNVVQHIFPMKPADIIKRLELKNPIYSPTASYGHMGRNPFVKEVDCFNIKEIQSNGSVTRKVDRIKKNIRFFTWEEMDYVDNVRKAFHL
ncbi:MAG: methionine adenosyltransferase [Bacteroidetes bacterium RIFCSPLOWO2_12_FULL_37_12]|nr:MAG: methionine adenosyltransferase [Bacteroidetes bacterium RIFCSPLOWO2_12_FULL_37_12]